MIDRSCYIYAITNLKTGRRYVGSTIDIKSRWKRHRKQLKENIHHCQYLQNSWNKHGESSFEFSILCTLPTNERKTRHLEEIKQIDALPCFNNRIASADLQNFENGSETRKRISAGIRKAMDDDPDFARRLKEHGTALGAFMKSEEGKKLISEATKRRWTVPEERERLFSGIKNRWSDPEERIRQGEKIRKARSSPEARKRISEASKAAWARPDSKQHTRRNIWNDPGAKEAQSVRLKEAWARRKAKMAEEKSKA